eukprot:5861218-Alexandrium_andersonii.AAC.1
MAMSTGSSPKTSASELASTMAVSALALSPGTGLPGVGCATSCSTLLKPAYCGLELLGDA